MQRSVSRLPRPHPLLPILLTLALATALRPLAADAHPLLDRLGVSRGICAVVGDPRGDLALELAQASELILYLQIPDAPAATKTRQRFADTGLLGTRIYVEHGPADRLFLADNIADGLVDPRAAPAIQPAEAAEAIRVVHPRAKVLLGNSTLTKPVPPGVDDWTHPYHLPDNKSLSRDQLARAPYLTQFLAEPRYAPMPQSTVASAGRVFKAFGHLAFKEREEPWLDTLAAFNGYNGTLLWRRDIASAIMVHRNTLIATPTNVFFGDDTSCKVFDAATGELRTEIAPPADIAGGTFWKWMALQDGVLYALIGDQEFRDPVIRNRSRSHGWPWNPLSPGFNRKDQPWGYGRTLLAIEIPSAKVLWQHREEHDIDSRALCMHQNRIYAFRSGEYLACIDAQTGRDVWRVTRTTHPEVFSELGESLPRQDWRTNWRTTTYLQAADKALYFAGPTMSKLIALSTDNGRILWQHPYSNYQIVVTDNALYGIGGQIDQDPARVFDPLTGKILREIPFGRRACARVTGAVDALFCRASGGSTRFDLVTQLPHLLSPMRPNCHDGVTIANGLLYWWPSVCDCNLTLYGITCLGPAGNFNFSQPASPTDRLQIFTPSPPGNTATATPGPDDWPTFRANNLGTVTTSARIPLHTQALWQTPPTVRPTAPVATGNLVLAGGTDGLVRAFDTHTGKPAWTACTGGALTYPPACWRDIALAGSGDGCVYAFDLATGRTRWRFRAAPAERRIPVYGTLQSTWPVGSGVRVDNGVAYAAAGIVNYDGTHVYALDAATGILKWQNNTSGHLDPDARSGVSVQGHLALTRDKLYLPGGNALSPAVYSLADGKCLNDPNQLRQKINNNVPGSFQPRGSELYAFDNRLMVSGKPLYAHPHYDVYDDQVLRKTLLATAPDRAVAWINNEKLLCLDARQPDLAPKVLAAWGKSRIPNVSVLWEKNCRQSLALALAPNAVVVARKTEAAAYDLQDGRTLWNHPLPVPPVPWGLCVTRHGQVILTLENGAVLCLAPPDA
ncbi:MAG: PQQ-binding-like beta-propeller repeat protein [Verrucomicrobia bacterium]|nr:PQQ-binding-like beta-propeller repeat protein [Verrucomicrobiota bacterium]